jgi:hypothetical protein
MGRDKAAYDRSFSGHGRILRFPLAARSAPARRHCCAESTPAQALPENDFARPVGHPLTADHRTNAPVRDASETSSRVAVENRRRRLFAQTFADNYIWPLVQSEGLFSRTSLAYLIAGLVWIRSRGGAASGIAGMAVSKAAPDRVDASN